ncbi:MAG: hypothetical protein IPK07_26310 [Deltaproteobacteria bacterium]|nr:hypothetical protein [Deltaproteobacteria bacterium]
MSHTRSLHGRLALVVAITLAVPRPARAAPAPAESGGAAPSFFEYLYAEPNSGAASGGHVAIRIGENVYHFQQVEGGILRLFRVDAARFDHSYRALGNRTLTVTRVAVPPGAAEELRWAFEGYRQRQDGEFGTLDERRRDLDLLRAWRLTGGDHGVAAVAASGYFASGDAPPEEADGSEEKARRAGLEALRRVAARIEGELGAGYLARRSRELALTIESLDEASLGEGIARRYTDLAAEWLAVELLADPPPLAAGSWVSLDVPEFALEARDRTRLRELADTVADAAVALAQSSRPDRGDPLLVALARLEALERSIASGRLVLLDPARGDEALVPTADVRASTGALRRILAERGDDFRYARDALFAPDSWDEGRLSRLELAGAAWADLAGALERGAPLRIPTPFQIPSRVAPARAYPKPALAPAVLAGAHERAARAEAAALARLRERYPYDLVTRNCVTELFAILATVPLEAHVDAAGALHFVPLAASHAVADTYPGSRAEVRPSFRVRALDAFERCDGSALATDLREASTLTAHSYTPNDADPLFLFFTDDAVALRPLLGVLNLAVGAGGTVAGAALAPWDGGTLLRRGWEGVIFSVPELAFVSLRRGTIPFAPLGWESDLRERCVAPRT